MWGLQIVFALEDEALLWTPDKQPGKLLLDEILRSSNFGQIPGEKKTRWLIGKFLLCEHQDIKICLHRFLRLLLDSYMGAFVFLLAEGQGIQIII